MQVVILCGGQGTRAYPITRTLPKALMQIDGVPIVEQVMRIYASQGYTEFILACGYLMETIEAWVAESHLPWDVRCVDTGADADTGDRIKRVRHMLRGMFHATYCDGLGDVDLAALVAAHKSRGQVATVTAAPLRSQYGLVHADGDDRVIGFEEKPVLPDVWINGGFFVFDPAVFDTWEGHNLERDVLPALAQHQQLSVYRHRGFWRSMDTYKDQQELTQLWAPYSEQFAAASGQVVPNGALSESMRISIVIPTWNRGEILEQTLRRLFVQDYPRDKYEIVVVDNACTDGTPDMLRRLAAEAPVQLRSFRIEPNNLSRARNTGLQNADGEIVLYIGDDILPEPFMLAEHAKFHSKHPRENVAVLSQVEQIHLPGESPFEQYFDPFLFSTLAGQTELNYLYFWTNNLSVKREFLLKYGLFDEEFHDAAHEDVELGYRLNRHGLRIIYNDRLTGRHLHPMTFEKACRQQFHRGLTFHLAERKMRDDAYRERIGIFSWRNSPRRIFRDLVRETLFNRYTVPLWRAYLESRKRRSRAADFLYWKVLSHYTMAGYRAGRRGASAGNL